MKNFILINPTNVKIIFDRLEIFCWHCAAIKLTIKMIDDSI